MCGIAGYNTSLSTQSSLPNLSEAVLSMQHRGPDGNGVFVDENHMVGLAHVRLSIIDTTETGAQPMHSLDGSAVLSYNGEIYNFPELREMLEASGHYFIGNSDTEVLLKLLQSEGLSVLSSLNGMFAFAYFNSNKGEVTLVRDGYGVKPLYYCQTQDSVLFASEIRGLKAMGVELYGPNCEAVGRYLSFLWNPGSDTAANNIFSVQPGEAITLKNGRILRRWNWFKSPIFSPLVSSSSDNDLVKQTVDIFRAAVHRQMIADVPVGAFLSGGLDSSAVVAMAREKSHNIKCFTIETSGGPEEGMADDLPYARLVADHLSVPLEVVQVDPEQMAKDLELMVCQLEEPIADPACLNTLYISQRARENGIKVLLSGTGGDDLFSGYRRHYALTLDERFQQIPLALRRGIESCSKMLSHSRPGPRRIAKFLDGFGSDGVTRLINYFLWTNRKDVLELFNPEIRAGLKTTQFTQPMQDYVEKHLNTAVPLNSMLALEQRFFLAEHNLIYTDKMSMAASVEVRVPFLDLDLAAYAASLPVNTKQRKKEGKWILKKAMETYLPHKVIYRPKSGFGVPLRRWLSGGLKDYMYELLSAHSISRRGLFDPKSVAALIEKNANGEKDASYTIFSLMCIEIWCRAFLDNTQMSLDVNQS